MLVWSKGFKERLLKDHVQVPRNRNSNVNSFIMCFDTDSINTATEINMVEEDNHQHKISFIDNENGNNQQQQQQSNKFESHFTFPPIAQMEEFDLSDSDSL